MSAGIGLIGVVGAATLLAILFRGGGGSGGGSGAGTGTGAGAGAPAATQAARATQPTRPLKVTIEGSNYVVDGRTLDLAGVAELASKVPPGDGAAVVVERPGTSRAKAEEDLFAALDKRGIRYMKD